MKKLFLLALWPVIAFCCLYGQSPQKINYQAVLRHSDGTVITDSQASLRISIRKGGIAGQSVYSETHKVLTNNLGLINIAIGAGTSTQNFAEIDWGIAGNLWVCIEFDPDGGNNYQLMGGMQLVSVPYALFSEEAASAPVVLKSMTDTERQALQNPPVGLMILNTTTNKLNIYHEDGWYETGGEKLAESFSCGQLMVDQRDGRQYKTVKIGDQCWMAENLDFGTMIVGSVDQTNNGVFEKYCYQNSQSYCNTYGALYQWDELMDYTTVKSSRGICPQGWHIPSDQEVMELEIALGMDPAVAARANTWRGTTNEGAKMAPGGGSGYDAQYGGRRVTGGMYTAAGSYDYLWTSSESGTDAWRRCLSVDSPLIGRYDTFPKSYGMSVRCILD